MLRVVLCNCKPEQSRAIARTLVEEKLAACVNIISDVTSFYRWQGEVCEDEEHTLLIKTTAERYERLKTRLQAIHSYEVPEIIALDSLDVLDTYARWAYEQVGNDDT
jgi:periplasmic divalent cation tolerance protein